MADYPQELIAKLDAQCTKEGWPLVGMFLMAVIVAMLALFIVGQILNKL